MNFLLFTRKDKENQENNPKGLRAVYAVRNPFFKKDNDMTGIELKQLIDKCATELERLEIIAAANLGERSEAAKRALAKREERIKNKNNNNGK